MNVTKTFKVIVICLVPMIVLSSCKHHARSPQQLRSRAKKELIAGCATGVVSVGAAATGGLAEGLAAGLCGSTTMPFAVIGGVAAFTATCLLPLAVVTAPVAITLIVKGVKHRRQAKQCAMLEKQNPATFEMS